jgi:2-hydroxy-3-keto-5-methylthiopentenyl-1-phosphate phosphatase
LVSIWTDFDGTITRSDFGHVIIKTYGIDWERFLEMEKQVSEGLLSLRKGLIKEYGLVRMTEKQMLALASEEVVIDPHFVEFLEFTRDQDMPVTILSDGFKQYIEFILRKNCISFDNKDIKANEVTFHDNKTLELSFPHVSLCDNCANCKRSHLDAFKKENPGCLLIYIGDGMSDLYGSRVADFTFARRSSNLEKYFKNRKLGYHPFKDFNEVLRGVKELLEEERENPGYFEQVIKNRLEFPFPCKIEAI